MSILLRYQHYTLFQRSSGKNYHGIKHLLVSMILSSDGFVYDLCALMCGSVAALGGLEIWNERRNIKVPFYIDIVLLVYTGGEPRYTL